MWKDWIAYSALASSPKIIIIKLFEWWNSSFNSDGDWLSEANYSGWNVWKDWIAYSAVASSPKIIIIKLFEWCKVTEGHTRCIIRALQDTSTITSS